MQPKKLTPLEALHKQRADLRVKSSELTGSIENHAKYLHRHFGLLLRNSLVESAVSKMPPQMQNVAGYLLKKDDKTDTHDFSVSKVIQGIIIGVTEIAPFFLKGKKGAFLSIIMKQVAKWMRCTF